jgi:thiol:disulfide interchange protein DsbD
MTKNSMINKIFLSLLVLLSQVATFAASSDDLLKPDDAFKASITSDSPDKIQVSWDIADGYYMYRKRYSFKSDTQGITLGEPVFPKGKIKEDPGFGSVEVYRHKMLAEIPIIRSDSSASVLSLKTSSQGCADIGVCYPPQKKTLSIKLATATIPEPTTSISKSPITAKKSFSLADELGITGIDNANAPLPPDQVFAYDVSATDKQSLNARWNITEGHYLYQHKLKFSLVDPAEGVSLGEPVLPKGKKEHDQYYGDIVIYNKDFDVQIPVIGKADSITVKTSYQGCSKLTGICYPPQTKTQTINLASAADSSTASVNQAAVPAIAETAKSATTTSNSSEDITFNSTQKISTGNDFLDKSLNSNNLLAIFLAALGAGLLLAFTACMYPMIPILSSIIVGQGKEVSMLKGLSLSSVYVLALAVTFGIVGAITASVASGVGIQAYFQNPWVLSAFALLFIILAFSMFGFYEIQVPAALQSKLTSLSNNQKGGSLIGVAVMGSLSALIVGPCGGPVLAAMLGYAAASSSMTNGFLALFALGLGMGLPLLVVGAGGGKLLPKAGNWMSIVKAVAGVILLAVALVILERMPNIFPTGFTMSLWSLLLIVSGIYLGALNVIKEGASGWMKLWKGLGFAAIVYGAIVMFGGQMGGQSVTDPLYGVNLSPVASSSDNSNSSDSSSHVSFKRIKTIEDLKREISAAKGQNKAVMLDFFADWCTYCVKYERYVFPKAKVRKHLDKMVLLQADVTAMDKTDTELMKALGISLPPAILFFGKDGKEIPASRIVGDMNADEFSAHLKNNLR